MKTYDKNNRDKGNREYKIDDEKISRLVQAVQYEVPPVVEDRLNRSLVNWGKSKTVPRSRFLSWRPAAVVLAATILIAALFTFQPFKKNTAEPDPISEIRTEFELKGKNIKIIWFQKKDFKLRRIQP